MGNIELESDLGGVIKVLEAPVSEQEKAEGWTAEKKTKWRDRLVSYRTQIANDEVVEPLSSAVREMKADGVEPSRIADMVSRVVFTHGLTRR
jgi:hypothetical protein